MSNYSDLVGIGVTSGIKRILTGNVVLNGQTVTQQTINITVEAVNPSKTIIVLTSFVTNDSSSGSGGNGASTCSFTINPGGTSFTSTFIGNAFQTCTVGYALLEFT